MAITLSKYQALGNDYLIYDPGKNGMTLNRGRVRMICDRHYGPGSDGILEGPIMKDGAIALRIYNPDGGEAEKSGSGTRIFSKYLRDAGYVSGPEYTLYTLGGPVVVQFLNEDGSLMRAQMGKTSFLSTDIPVAGPRREVVGEAVEFLGRPFRMTCVSIGNPHCVILLDEFDADFACKLGEVVERHPLFPQRINVQLMQVIDRNNIRIEIYERGAGYTLASGTSSCAAASAAHRLGLCDELIHVHMPGGRLKIEIEPSGMVCMTGSVGKVMDLTLAPELERALMGL